MKQMVKKVAALMLAATMVLGAVPTAYAGKADGGAGDDTPILLGTTVTTDNTSIPTAYDISSGESASRTIPRGKYCYYVYTAQEPGYVTFTLSRGDYTLTDSAKWYFYLYDARMNELDRDTIKDSYTTEPYLVQKGDVFYLSLYSYSYDSGDVVAHAVQASFTAYPDVEKENNDSSSSATALKLNKEYIGSILDSNDVDYYAIKADKSGIYTISFDRYDFSTTASAKWKFTLYDAKMNELYTINTNTNSDGIDVDYALQKGKTIYVKISDYSYSSGTIYAIKATYKAATNIETEPNNSFSAADSIKVGTTYTGTLAEKSTSDYYVIKPEKAGTYKVTYKLKEDITYGQKVSVYDSSHKLVAESKEIYKSGSVKFKAKKGKKYYVVVSHTTNGWSGGYSYGAIYTLKVTKN